MKLFTKYTKYVMFFILITCLSNCSEDEVTPPQAVAGFTFTIEDDKGTVRFLNISENANSYEWDFGDGETSSEIAPIKKFATGTFTINLKATNETGQSNTFSDQISIQVIEAVSLPVSFDGTNVDYTPTIFDGATFEIIDNPDESGTNNKASKVGAITNSGAQFEGLFFNLGDPIDFSTDKAIAMNFWAQSPVDVLLKLEKPSGAFVETTVSHGGTGWEKIAFNFTSSDQFSILTLFVDGSGTTSGTFYFDDVEQTEVINIPILPTAPAPTPSQAVMDVISIYSDAYDDVAKEGFNLYGAAAFEEVQIMDNGALKYTAVEGDGGIFQVIELGGANKIDATAAGMTNFRFDLWFPNEVNASSAFLLKLVNIVEAGNSEALVNINTSANPSITQGTWLQYDFLLTDLQDLGLENSSDIQQIVIDLVNTGEVYVDNIYFYKKGSSGDIILPTAPAPTPMQVATNVISIYSDAYDNVSRDGFNFYGNAVFEEADIMGNGALKYTFAEGDGGNFQVIELGGANQIDAASAGMTNFRFDLWFPNQVDANSAFLMKLVDIGTTTTEAQINIGASSNPVISQGSWLQFDIPFSELQNNGLESSSNVQQIVIDLLTSPEVYIDNIYFYKSTGGGGETGGIIDLTFSDTTSIDDWMRVADANSAEASIEWIIDGGVEGGAMKVSASNPSDAAGKAYIFQLTANELNYDGATDVKLTFDLKLLTPLTAAAVHLQTNIPGVGVTDNFDLQNNGLNDTGFTSYSFDFSGVDAGANTFTIHFNFASGAVTGAGGELLVENIKLVKTN